MLLLLFVLNSLLPPPSIQLTGDFLVRKVSTTHRYWHAMLRQTAHGKVDAYDAQCRYSHSTHNLVLVSYCRQSLLYAPSTFENQFTLAVPHEVGSVSSAYLQSVPNDA